MAQELNIDLPNSWEDLTASQLKKLGKLFFGKVNKKLFELELFIILSGVRWFEFKKIRRLRYVIGQIPLSDLRGHYDFIFRESNRKSFIPSIRIRGRSYRGPKPFLFDLTIEEFSVVDDLYFRYRSIQDPDKKREILEYMAGVLYLRKPLFFSFRSDRIRADFSVSSLEDLRAPFKSAGEGFLKALLISYQGCRFLLEKRYKRVFSGSGAKPGGKKYGFGKVILQMAGGKFGNHRETKITLLHTFLEQLNEDLTPKK